MGLKSMPLMRTIFFYGYKNLERAILNSFSLLERENQSCVGGRNGSVPSSTRALGTSSSVVRAAGPVTSLAVTSTAGELLGLEGKRFPLSSPLPVSTSSSATTTTPSATPSATTSTTTTSSPSSFSTS